MLWQSSLLIGALFALDLLFRHRLRASIRYAFWLVVLVKLCVPPTLALPTSPAWWLHQTPPPLVAKPVPHYTVTYDNGPLPEIPQTPLPTFVPSKPVMANAAWLLVTLVAVSSALLCWLLVRWWQITLLVRRAAASERLTSISNAAQGFVGMRWKVQVKVTANSMSPAVCGLFRPAILIPQSLAENFSDEQMRAVLLHELIHLRRRDVWLNFVQALLQIIYWWHPLVWLANARIRRVREEAVDDAVMLALRDESEAYAPTLLEVAKLALNRPLASLGLVGILESRHALRQRIERLIDFRPPQRAGLTLVSLVGILAFTAVAVPMGNEPAPAEKQTNVIVSPPVLTNTPINVRATSLSNPSISMPLSQTNFEQLLQEGKLLYETDKLDEAAGKFVRALAADPSNADAQHFLSLIVSLRKDNSGKPSFGREDIIVKLHSVRLEQVAFAASPLSDVLRHLSQQAKSNDPEKQGVNFLLNLNPGGSAPDGSGQTSRTAAPLITIDPPLTNSSLGDVLDAVVRGASEPINYSVQDYAIVFWTGKPPEPLEPRVFKVDTNVFPAAVLRQAAQSGFELPDDTVNRVGLAFRHLSAAAGVNWYAPGKRIVYNEKSRSIDVSATAGDLRVLRQLVAALNKNQPGLQSSTNALPASPVSTHAVIEQITNTGAMTVTGILADPNFRVVIKALEQRNGSETLTEPEVVTTSGHGVNRIRTDNLSAPLSQRDNSELVQDGKLLYEMGKLDEAEVKLKAALMLDAENAAAKYYLGLVQSALQHPTTNQIKTGRQKIMGKLEHIQLDQLGPFMGVSLGEVVRQLNETAKQNDPEKTGVNFSIATNLVSGQPSDISFLADINLPSALKNVTLVSALEAIVQNANMPLKYSSLDNGVVFSLKDTQQLFSRHFKVSPNTFIAALRNTPGFQTNDVVTMARSLFSKLGVDFTSGKSVFFNDRLGELFVRATASDLDTVEQAVVDLTAVAPQIHLKARFLEVPKGTLAGLKNIISVTNPPAGSNQVARLAGILTDKNFRTVWRNLEANPGAETLAEPEVVTTSGRQTQMRATHVVSIITNFVFEEIVTNVNSVLVTNNAITPKLQQIESGPIVDVVPNVLVDGTRIDLGTTAQVVEFWGYAFIPTNAPLHSVTNSAGEQIDLPLIWPAMQISRATADVSLHDGETLLMALNPPEQIRFAEPDEKREAVVAKHIRDGQKKNKGGERETIVFITATLVDPAGNRIHPER